MISSFTDFSEFPLIPLVNLAIFAKENDNQIYPYFLCIDGIPHIFTHLNECKNLQELYYITKYLKNLNMLITKDIMTLHKSKMKLFLSNPSEANRAELFAVFFKHSKCFRNFFLFSK